MCIFVGRKVSEKLTLVMGVPFLVVLLYSVLKLVYVQNPRTRE